MFFFPNEITGSLIFKNNDGKTLKAKLAEAVGYIGYGYNYKGVENIISGDDIYELFYFTMSANENEESGIGSIQILYKDQTSLSQEKV